MSANSRVATRFGWADVARLLAVAAAYFVAAKFGLSLAFATQQVTAVWPPTGVAFAALLLLGRRVWPGILLGAFVANATANEPLVTAAGIALGNTLAGLLGVWLTRRLAGELDESLGRLRDVLSLVVGGAALASTLSASAGVANLALCGIVPWSAYGSVWWLWWLGDALGVLIFAPFLLGWLSRRGRATPVRAVELALLLGLLGLVCQLTFVGQLGAKTSLFRLEYAVFPFVIGAAVRFGQREAATSSVVVAGFAIWGAIHDRGPFASGELDERLMLLDVFMAVVATTALTLSAVVTERRHAEQALERARGELERRVLERTAELGSANTELGKKNEEVEAFVYIVSHDLRAPLVNLEGFSSELSRSCAELTAVLAKTPLAPEVESEVRRILGEDIPGALHYIEAGTAKFQRLIDALLTLSRQGRQPYRQDELDVQALVQTTLDSLQQSISQAHAKITVGQLPRARGDATALGQVFANLLVNALSYLEPERPGQIEIGGRRAGDVVEYWVKDNGVGIPKAAERRLFQVFQRFHPKRAQGEGMGLAIVKRVVERHGGRVWAESEEGVGTTFRLTLPAPT